MPPSPTRFAPLCVAAATMVLACAASPSQPQPAPPAGKRTDAAAASPRPTEVPSATAPEAVPSPSNAAPPPPTSSSAQTPSASGKAAVDIVARLPDVTAYCASLQKAAQPAHCVMWSEDENAPSTRCAANATYLDACLWPVYVGESQPAHTVRYATMWVNLTSRAVVAVSDFACGQMPLKAWRAWRAKVAASPTHPPDCPEPKP